MNARWIVGTFAVLALAAQAGCGSTESPGEAPRTEVQLVPLPLHRPERGDRTALPRVVRASNSFALDLYHALRTEPGNLLVSPGCLTAGLELLRAGAHGETAAEIDRVLHRPGGVTDRNLAAFIQDLNADGRAECFQIRVANAVWIPQGYTVLEEYRRALHDVFALGTTTSVDFTGDSAEAARTVSGWVSDRTGGKITQALPAAAMAAPTKLALTAAIYFRGNWLEGFYRPVTKHEAFHTDLKRSVTVPMMHMTALANVHGYLDGGTFELLSLVCGEGAFAMDVFLPKTVDGLGDLEAMLTPDMLADLWRRLVRPPEIIVSLPRFRVSTSRPLEPVLKQLGLSRAFDPKKADFSKISGKSADLYLSAASHETFLDVNEEGIEAAAFMGMLTTDSDRETQSPVIRADHPFLYLVRDSRTNCIVFLGRVIDPKSP